MFSQIYITRAIMCVDWPGYTKRVFTEPVYEVLRERTNWLANVAEEVELARGEVLLEVADTSFSSFGMWEDAIKCAESLLEKMKKEVKIGIFWGPLYIWNEEVEGPAMCAAATLGEEWADNGVALACVPEVPHGWDEHRFWPLGDGKGGTGALMIYKKRC